MTIQNALLTAPQTYYERDLGRSPSYLIGSSLLQTQMPATDKPWTAFGTSLARSLLGTGLSMYGQRVAENRMATDRQRLAEALLNSGGDYKGLAYNLEETPGLERYSPYAAQAAMAQKVAEQEAKRKLQNQMLAKGRIYDPATGSITYDPNYIQGEAMLAGARAAAKAPYAKSPSVTVNLPKPPNPNPYGPKGVLSGDALKKTLNMGKVFDGLKETTVIMDGIAKKDNSWLGWQSKKLFPSTEEAAVSFKMEDIKDMLTRARTGAALNKTEEAFYEKIVTGGKLARPSDVAKVGRILIRGINRSVKADTRTAEAAQGGIDTMLERFEVPKAAAEVDLNTITINGEQWQRTPEGGLRKVK